MSLYSTLGAERNLLDETPEHARLLRARAPGDHATRSSSGLREDRAAGLRSAHAARVCSRRPRAAAGLRAALDRLCRRGRRRRCAAGVNILILSDRGVSPELAPIPMLLATGAVHHHLIREGSRTRCGIVCETGEAREVAHFALLIGYGAGAINPYLAFETIDELVEDGSFVPEELDAEDGASRTTSRPCDKGLLKIVRQDGDLDAAAATAARRSSRRSGSIASSSRAASPARRRASRESATTCSRARRCMRHERAFPDDDFVVPGARSGRPLSVACARRAAHVQPRHRRRSSSTRVRQRRASRTFKEFSQAADDEAERLCTLRGLFRFKFVAGADPARRGRAGQRDREALLHRRDVATARSRSRRTRRSRSR